MSSINFLWNTRRAQNLLEKTKIATSTKCFAYFANYLLLIITINLYALFSYGYLFINYWFCDYLDPHPNTNWYAFWAHSMLAITVIFNIVGIMYYLITTKRSPHAPLTQLIILGPILSVQIIKKLIFVLVCLSIVFITLFRYELGFFPQIIQSWNKSLITFAHMYGLKHKAIEAFLVPPKTTFGIFNVLLLPIVPYISLIKKAAILTKLNWLRTSYLTLYLIFSLIPLLFSWAYYKKLVQITKATCARSCPKPR